ncbi:MAG: GNAT family N-acetyltransferase [Clostridiales bacterium]|nr:GNAT family N-acetyltransferase [Clostridiales bacterium]
MTGAAPAARLGLPGEEGAQKALWTRCFEDGADLLDYFYDHCCESGDVVTVGAGDRTRAMAVLLSVPLRLPDGRTVEAGYFYAFCTRPEDRGRGLGALVLDKAHETLKARGCACITTVPANEYSRRYFARHGFSDFFRVRQCGIDTSALPPARPGDAAEPVGPAAYASLREACLAGTLYSVYSDALLGFQHWLAETSGGGLYRILLDGAAGCAAVGCEGEGRAAVRELLLPDGAALRGLSALAKRLPARRWQVRTPAFQPGLPGADTIPFAMIQWYDPVLARAYADWQGGHFGLGFD